MLWRFHNLTNEGIVEMGTDCTARTADRIIGGNLIIERVRAGMRRARIEGRHIGRMPLTLDREAICSDRRQGQSLRQIARCHRISTATVRRVLQEHAPPQRKEVA